MDEEPEPERLPLQFDNYPADLLMSLEDHIPTNNDIQPSGMSSASLNNLPVDGVPQWRVVGVLLAEADRDDLYNTYKLEVIREMTMPGTRLKMGVGKHDVLGYLCGLGCLEVPNSPEVYGRELIVPFYSPTDLSIFVTALSLDTATDGLRKVGVLDIPSFSAPLYLTRSFPPDSLPGCIYHDLGIGRVYLLKDENLLVNVVDWSLKYSPPFVTVFVQQVPVPDVAVSAVREGKKRARTKSSPKTLGSRKLMRLEQPSLLPDLHHGYQELPGGWLDITVAVSQAAFNIGQLVAGNDETSPQESELPHPWDDQGQAYQRGVGGQAEASSSGGYRDHEGLGEGYGLGEVNSFQDLFSFQPQETSEGMGREEYGPSASKRYQEPDEGQAQHEQEEYGPSTSDGYQGQEAGDEVGDEQRGQGEHALDAGGGYRGEESAEEKEFGESAGGVLPTMKLKWVQGDWVGNWWCAHYEPGDLVLLDSDSIEDDEDYGTLEEELVAISIRPSIYMRDLSVLTDAHVPGLVVLYYRRFTVEPNRKVSTLIGTPETIKAIVKVILPILIQELCLESRSFSPAQRTIMIEKGVIKIHNYIKVLKGYARTIVHGPRNRGGYGIADGLEGIPGAKSLIVGDSYLYRGGSGHDPSDARYGHPAIRQNAHKIGYPKFGPDSHPFRDNKDNVFSFYGRPELRTMKLDTSSILSCGILLEQIYIAAGDKVGGREIIQSPEWWDATTADYFKPLNINRLEPVEGQWAETIPLSERCVKITGKNKATEQNAEE